MGKQRMGAPPVGSPAKAGKRAIKVAPAASPPPYASLFDRGAMDKPSAKGGSPGAARAGKK